MPPNTESQPVLPPDKNLTFTQFFTKLLIKVSIIFIFINFKILNEQLCQVPKVDIEKLPSYLLRDHLVPDKDYIKEHDEDKDDIYSLEHQENVEEFKPKGLNYLLKLKFRSKCFYFRYSCKIHKAHKTEEVTA